MVDKRLKYLLYFLMIISLFLSIKNKVKAEEISITPTISYRYPTNNNSIQNNVVYADARYWGVKVLNTGLLTNLEYNLPYTPPSSTDLYNYSFKIYSNDIMPIVRINGMACSTEYVRYNGTQSFSSGPVYLVNCFNIPYKASPQNIKLNLDYANVSGHDSFIGLANTIGIVRVPSDSSNISTAINNQTNSINNNLNNVNNSIQNTNNTLNDSSTDNQKANDTFSNLNSNMASNGTISTLLLMPITLLQKILNAMSGTCSAINTGQLLGEDFILPCISIPDLIGSGLWSVIDVIGSGALAYAIGKKFIKIFNQFTNLKEGGLESAYD